MRKIYWKTDAINAHNADYRIVIGGRNLGKSYAIATGALQEAYDAKQPTFMLVKRIDTASKPHEIESYFADKPISAITKGEYNTIAAQAGIIYFANTDPTTFKTVKGMPCGYYAALNIATNKKSGQFPTVRQMIYEEFCPEDSRYLTDEPRKLMSFVSTVFRSRKPLVWLIGNTTSRINPYFRYWNLRQSLKQEINTIIDYSFPSEDEEGNPITVKISVERAPSNGAANGYIVGHAAKSINAGDFECKIHPKLEKPLDCYTFIYSVLLKNDGFDFVLNLLSNDETGQLLLFAYPYTGKREYDRVLSVVYDENPMHSVWFDKDREIESKILDLLNAQQIAFSDNLTGDECIATLRTLKTSTL